ncbi:MAG: cupin domain-containing protein [Candidatus Babeliales bacterium]
MIFHKNIMHLTKENDNFRNVLATGIHSQIVLMSLKPGEDIGYEVHHDVDQVLVFTEGNGLARINDKEYNISPGDIFLVPAGTQHNFINTGKQDLKLFTIYAPAEHEQGIIQKLKPKK